MRAGLLAEFETPELLLEAARSLRGRGLTQLDAFTPWPVKGMDEVLHLPRSGVARVTLIGGLSGAAIGYLIQWWTAAWDYPLIVGARPPHSAPAFVPITFETTVLVAGFSALFSLLYYAGLPQLWNPVFEVDAFRSATIDRFWLAVDAQDPAFDALRHRTELTRLGALKVLPFGKAPL